MNMVGLFRVPDMVLKVATLAFRIANPALEQVPKVLRVNVKSVERGLFWVCYVFEEPRREDESDSTAYFTVNLLCFDKRVLQSEVQESAPNVSDLLLLDCRFSYNDNDGVHLDRQLDNDDLLTRLAQEQDLLSVSKGINGEGSLIKGALKVARLDYSRNEVRESKVLVRICEPFGETGATVAELQQFEFSDPVSYCQALGEARSFAAVLEAKLTHERHAARFGVLEIPTPHV